MKHRKGRKEGFSISFRLFDEHYDAIFSLTKENYKKGLKELDRLLRVKLGEDLDKIIKEK